MSKKGKSKNFINPHKLKPLKLQVYWAMDNLRDRRRDRFSIQEITIYLIEKIGIKTSVQAVRYALNSDRRAIHKEQNGYKLMQYGRDKLLPTEDNILFIEAQKPFTGKKLSVNNIFSKLKGDIRICDVYCGPGLIDFVFKGFSKSQSVKILTQNIIDRPKGIFVRTLKDIKDEGYNIQIKIYKNSVLHDRYLIDDNNVWLSGNSFNDLGRKESFIVLLGKDVRQSLLSTFNGRWKVGKVFS